MGVEKNVSLTEFPKQYEDQVNQKVQVYFNYDTSQGILGTMVRSDAEDPYRGIIKLDDGRYILTTECQYTFQIVE